MSNDRATPGAGDVEITLDGETKILRQSLGAAISISRMSGGISAAQQRVIALDLDTIVAVVRAGLDLTDVGAKGLDAKVWRSGLAFENGISVPVQTYLNNLANGGRPRSSGGEQDTENPPKND